MLNHLIREAGVYTADAALPTAETANQLEGATPATPESGPASTEASLTTDSFQLFPPATEQPKQSQKVEDLPTNEEKQLRPSKISSDTNDLLKWEPGKRVDDDMNRASVPLRELRVLN